MTAKVWFWAASLAAVGALAAVASQPRWQAAGLAAAGLPLLAALPRLGWRNLVVSFLAALHLVQFFKRAIFLLGPQQEVVYWGIQLLPSLILILLMAGLVRRPRGPRAPGSAWILATFVALATATTLASVSRYPGWLVATSIHQGLLPFLTFFVGLTLPLHDFGRLGRVLVLLMGFSVLYGFLQLAGGPTLIDRLWATQTFHHSIQGGKVHAYLIGSAPEFRAFSYYADPLTWGLFLLAGFAVTKVARELKQMSRAAWRSACFFVIAGLFLAMTRTPWAGLAAAVLASWMLHRRWLRRPWLLFLLLLSGFAVAVAAGDFLYRELFLARRLPVFDNAIVARYVTVGTIEARTSAWDALQEAALQAPLAGEGCAASLDAARNPQAASRYKPLQAHNFVVELVVTTGIPGALLFLGFCFQWLREAMHCLRGAVHPGHQRALLWIVAFTLGSLFTGYLNGPTFMTYEFFLAMGVVSGSSARAGRIPEPVPERPGRNRRPLMALDPHAVSRG